MTYQFKRLDRRHSDSIKWQMAEKACKCDQYYTFSVADSDYETAPCVKEALLNRVDHGAFGYAGKGEDYEKIIISWYRERYGLALDKDWIIPVPSVLNALSVIIDLFTLKGENVIIQTPVYHVFKPVIEQNQRYVVHNPLKDLDGHYEMDYQALEILFKKGYKTLVLCNPHNPVGRVWSELELKRLVDLAHKYGVLIISDEIHSDIIMPNNQFTSILSYQHIYEHMIVISAPTKVFNIAGLKIAQIITSNKDFEKKIKAAYERLHLSTPNLLALTALKAAYDQGGTWVDAQNQHIYHNYQYLQDFLKTYKNYFQIYPLQGTYLVWIKVSLPDMRASQLVRKLFKYGVFLSEGKKFHTDDQYIRMSIACSKEQLVGGLKQWEKCMDDIKKVAK